MANDRTKKAIHSSRATAFLQANGLLKNDEVPAKLNRILSAFRQFDPPGFDAAKAIHAHKKSRKHKWALLVQLCHMHKVDVVSPAKQRFPQKNYEATDAFLESYEWRRVRMVVLKRDGARCACCGATPADGLRMHVDHIKPRRKFPELALDVDNLQVLCEVCNHGKGNWDDTDWRPTQEAANDEQQQHIRAIVEGQ